MAVDDKEIPKQEKEVEENFEELPLEDKLRIKTSIQDPPTNLEIKPLPKHLKYAFLKKDSLLPIVISALLKDDEYGVYGVLGLGKGWEALEHHKGKGIVCEMREVCLEVGSIRHIQELDTVYWGFLGVGTTLDIFQNIIFHTLNTAY
ncbi:hypothetical protein Tco_1195084 [Tanacetum coccineum]